MVTEACWKKAMLKGLLVVNDVPMWEYLSAAVNHAEKVISSKAVQENFFLKIADYYKIPMKQYRIFCFF